jgi:lipopolysaccharide export system permease protein
VKTLDRYICARFLWALLLVVCILAVLFSLFDLIQEMDEIGSGKYFLWQAFQYVALTLPGRVLELLPISALLASVLALGLLADRGELQAMQGAGLSVLRICWSVLAAGLVCILCSALMAEFVVPPLDQSARTRRAIALSGSGITIAGGGFWARNGLDFIHVRKTLYGRIPLEVDVFRRDKAGRLRAVIHASEADIDSSGRWLLKNVQQKDIGEGGITTRHLASLTLDTLLGPSQVQLQEVPPESLSPSDLYRYAKALRDRGQNAERFEGEFWRKSTMPLTTGAMILLSLTFVFGSPRGSGTGRRIVAGLMAGIGVKLGSDILNNLGHLAGIHPAFPALASPAAVAAFVLWRLKTSKNG